LKANKKACYRDEENSHYKENCVLTMEHYVGPRKFNSFYLALKMRKRPTLTQERVTTWAEEPRKREGLWHLTIPIKAKGKKPRGAA